MVTLYDLSTTYFDGEMAENGKARRDHSKERRSDCPLVTLGLVLDSSGFVHRSRMFGGNAIESATFRQKDGRTLHVRKTSVAESKLKQFYDALGISASPVGLRAMLR